MIIRVRRFVGWGFVSGVWIALSVPASAAQLNVFAFTVNPAGDPRNPTLNIVSNPPFITWSSNDILTKQGQWIPAQQFLGIRTDQPFKASVNWGIQIFTDNTYVANANTTFNIPDINSTDPPRLVTGPLTPKYVGYQSILRYPPPTNCQGTPDVVVPKSGLISNDGQTKVPVIWRLWPDVPFPNGQIPTITENPQCSACDFDGSNCEWFYFLDKGDQIVPPVGGDLQSDWQDNYWYSTPITKEGAFYSVCRPGDSCDGRWQLNYSNGFTTQILSVAANFRNATRQVYSTTLFVELFIQ